MNEILPLPSKIDASFTFIQGGENEMRPERVEKASTNLVQIVQSMHVSDSAAPWAANLVNRDPYDPNSEEDVEMR